MLHHLYQSRRKGRPLLTVSDVLEYELDALASEEEPAVIDRDIAGFEDATHFPSFGDRPRLVEAQCLFCGTTIEEGKEACAACAERHVPATDNLSRGNPDGGDRRN